MEGHVILGFDRLAVLILPVLLDGELHLVLDLVGHHGGAAFVLHFGVVGDLCLLLPQGLGLGQGELAVRHRVLRSILKGRLHPVLAGGGGNVHPLVDRRLLPEVLQLLALGVVQGQAGHRPGVGEVLGGEVVEHVGNRLPVLSLYGLGAVAGSEFFLLLGLLVQGELHRHVLKVRLVGRGLPDLGHLGGGGVGAPVGQNPPGVHQVVPVLANALHQLAFLIGGHIVAVDGAVLSHLAEDLLVVAAPGQVLSGPVKIPGAVGVVLGQRQSLATLVGKHDREGIALPFLGLLTLGEGHLHKGVVAALHHVGEPHLRSLVGLAAHNVPPQGKLRLGAAAGVAVVQPDLGGPIVRGAGEGQGQLAAAVRLSDAGTGVVHPGVVVGDGEGVPLFPLGEQAGVTPQLSKGDFPGVLALLVGLSHPVGQGVAVLVIAGQVGNSDGIAVIGAGLHGPFQIGKSLALQKDAVLLGAVGLPLQGELPQQLLRLLPGELLKSPAPAHRQGEGEILHPGVGPPRIGFLQLVAVHLRGLKAPGHGVLLPVAVRVHRPLQRPRQGDGKALAGRRDRRPLLKAQLFQGLVVQSAGLDHLAALGFHREGHLGVELPLSPAVRGTQAGLIVVVHPGHRLGLGRSLPGAVLRLDPFQGHGGGVQQEGKGRSLPIVDMHVRLVHLQGQGIDPLGQCKAQCLFKGDLAAPVHCKVQELARNGLLALPGPRSGEQPHKGLEGLGQHTKPRGGGLLLVLFGRSGARGRLRPLALCLFRLGNLPFLGATLRQGGLILRPGVLRGLAAFRVFAALCPRLAGLPFPRHFRLLGRLRLFRDFRRFRLLGLPGPAVHQGKPLSQGAHLQGFRLLFGELDVHLGGAGVLCQICPQGDLSLLAGRSLGSSPPQGEPFSLGRRGKGEHSRQQHCHQPGAGEFPFPSLPMGHRIPPVHCPFPTGKSLPFSTAGQKQRPRPVGVRVAIIGHIFKYVVYHFYPGRQARAPWKIYLKFTQTCHPTIFFRIAQKRDGPPQGTVPFSQKVLEGKTLPSEGGSCVALLGQDTLAKIRHIYFPVGNGLGQVHRAPLAVHIHHVPGVVAALAVSLHNGAGDALAAAQGGVEGGKVIADAGFAGQRLGGVRHVVDQSPLAACSPNALS